MMANYFFANYSNNFSLMLISCAFDTAKHFMHTKFVISMEMHYDAHKAAEE
jgi:hypothetical protein